MSLNIFRLQIYDDGAGEYLFDSPINNGICAGNEDNASALSGNAVGPFILPSPLFVTRPGQLTIQMTNVKTPLNTGFAITNNIVGYLALVFAVPKKCRGTRDGNMVKRRGVLS